MIGYLKLAGFAAVALMLLLPCWGFALPEIVRTLDRWRAAPRAKYMLLPLIVSLCYVGMTKHQSGTIVYPYTDVETRYLVDAGSYVTNDAVYVSFTRLLAPGSAPFIIDAIEIGKTNVEDFVSVWEGTFDEFENPSFVPFEFATNYNFYAYTTWTPGPSVKTNGVLDLYWQLDAKGNGSMIPIRTGVYLDGEKISPPRITIEANLMESPKQDGGSENE